MEAIGLQALFQDANFQAGISRYEQSVAHAESTTDAASGVLSKLGSIAGGALVVGFAAAAAGATAFFAAGKIGLDTLSAWNEQVNDLHDNLGVTGAQASAWAVAFNHVGLSVEEGGAGLNFFTKQLDDLKKVASPTTTTVTKLSTEALASLNQRLDDAKVRLERAQKTLSEAKNPTDQMRYAVEDAQKAIGRLNDQIAGGSGLVTKVKGGTAALSPFQKALQTLGINAFDAHGKLKTFDDIMPQLLDAFQKLPPGVQKSALAMDLFGTRGGTKFLDFLSQGSEGLVKARQMAELYGLSLDTDLSNAVEDFGFALNDTNLGLKGFWVTIGKAVLPVAVKFVNLLNLRLIPPLIALAKKIAPVIASAFDKVLDVFTNVLNIFDLLATGDFKGGIFGFTEDSIFIGALLTARDVVMGLFNTLTKGDWGGAWKVIAKGAQNLWAIINDQIGDPGTFIQGWAVKFWGFIQPIIAAIPAQVGGIINGIAGYFNAHGAEIWRGISEGAGGFWSWIAPTVTAIPGQVGGLLDSIGNFFSDHGAQIWSQMTSWATDFWDWLNGPAGAVTLAKANLFLLGNTVEGELTRTWLQVIKPALGTWTTQFWDWLVNPTTGALATGSQAIVDVTGKIKEWVNSAEVQANLVAAGGAVAKGIIEAIKGVFSTDANGNSLIGTLAENMGRASSNVGGIFQSVAQGFTKGVIKAITQELGLDPQQAELVTNFGLYLQRVAFAFVDSINPFNIAKTLIGSIIEQIKLLLTKTKFSELAPPPCPRGFHRIHLHQRGAVGAWAWAEAWVQLYQRPMRSRVQLPRRKCKFKPCLSRCRSISVT